jgi:hypothetical protein
MRPNRTPLTDDELTAWVAYYLQIDTVPHEPLSRSGSRGLGREDVAGANREPHDDAQQGARARAIIAGQQAIGRDLPHLAPSGAFTAAPAAEGGWIVRYSVHRADGFGAMPCGVVECMVAADGAAFVRNTSEVITPDQPRRGIALSRRR